MPAVLGGGEGKDAGFSECGRIRRSDGDNRSQLEKDDAFSNKFGEASNGMFDIYARRSWWGRAGINQQPGISRLTWQLTALCMSEWAVHRLIIVELDPKRWMASLVLESSSRPHAGWWEAEQRGKRLHMGMQRASC